MYAMFASQLEPDERATFAAVACWLEQPHGPQYLVSISIALRKGPMRRRPSKRSMQQELDVVYVSFIHTFLQLSCNFVFMG